MDSVVFGEKLFFGSENYEKVKVQDCGISPPEQRRISASLQFRDAV